MSGTLGIAVAVSALLSCASVPELNAQSVQNVQDVPLRTILITGAKRLSADTIRYALPVDVGVPLTQSTGQIVEAVEKRYHDDGYTFARVEAAFDAATGALSLKIDEGVIGAVEFQGVEDPELAKRFTDEYAVRAGDVFNRKNAMQALEVLLRQTRGAVRPGKVYFRDSSDLSNRRGTFDLIDRDGQRVLLVGLREPAGRFRMLPDLGDREDWFTAVDGFVPSLGFNAAVFDHRQFNHAYVTGHLSFKTAPDRGGYALGFERPIFRTRKLYLGGELHDLTASDDQWQVSSTEASLAAIGPRKSFRDYYRRRGVQITSAFRIHPRAELFLAWRGERHENLAVESDFSLWNDDEPFRPNRPAIDGRLSALIVGASLDGASFDRESLGTTYRRHLLEEPFGQRLEEFDNHRRPSPLWRIDWTSEISAPDALGSDFDFKRHLVSGRARVPLSPHQDFGVRMIGGWSDGLLPTQRLFSIGGLGSVHGYEFKEQNGNTLALMNLEYALGWRNAFQIVGFFDAGHASFRNVVFIPELAPRDVGWLRGVGFGIAVAGARVDFGYKLDAVPSSLQVTVRLGRTF
jgi:outer membrane protein assembly factor BamA